MLSEGNRSRKNSDIYNANNGGGNSKEIIHQDASKCNQILVNPYSGDKNPATVTVTSEKKDSIVSVVGHNINSFTVIPTVRRSTIGSKLFCFAINTVLLLKC